MKERKQKGRKGNRSKGKKTEGKEKKQKGRKGNRREGKETEGKERKQKEKETERIKECRRQRYMSKTR